MRIHAIQTGSVTIRPGTEGVRGRETLRRLNQLLDRTGPSPFPIWAYVIEHAEGIIVVDTGKAAAAPDGPPPPTAGTRAARERGRGANVNYRLNLHFAVSPEEEIGPQLRARGIAPDDVRWVVLTHLHPDHAGGVHYFPRAQVLVARDELAALDPAVASATRLPAWFDPHLVDFEHAPRGPFQRTRTLTVSGDVTLVATPGHSPGHLCLLAESDGTNYLFAGDAAFSQRALLEQVLAGVPHDPRQARESLALLLNFVRQTPTVFLPTHDPDVPDRLRRREVVPAC